ncbi:MAG: VWA domain-containing protein [Gemmataceae bacterium]
MPSFAYPWLLLLLPVAALVGWWRWRHRRPALKFSDARLLAELPAGRSRAARWLDTLLHAGAALALLLALAGPRLPLPTPITTEGIAVVLAVDVSGSMRELDFDWNATPVSRLEAVKRVFTLFVAGGPGPDGQVFAGRPNDLVGLVTFATYPETAAPLTLSHPVLLKILDTEQPRPLDEAQTNIGDAIAVGLNDLDTAGERRKVLILLSDGEHNFPGPASAPTWTPRKAAQRAQDLGIPIYTIDAGSDVGSTDPLARAAGVESMREVAQMTGGRSFTARDADSLSKVCQEIDRLERRPIQSFRYRRYRELHTWFGVAAFALLLAGRLFEMTAGRRFP